MQPFGQIQVIEDHGDFESRAIIRYLASKQAEKNPKLLGRSLEERVMVDLWLEVEAHNFSDPIYTIILHLVVFPRFGCPSDTALVESCKLKLLEV